MRYQLILGKWDTYKNWGKILHECGNLLDFHQFVAGMSKEQSWHIFDTITERCFEAEDFWQIYNARFKNRRVYV